jgi:hypothetical protein
MLGLRLGFSDLAMSTNYSRKGGKLRFAGTYLSDVVYSDAEMPGTEQKRLARLDAYISMAF